MRWFWMGVLALVIVGGGLLLARGSDSGSIPAPSQPAASPTGSRPSLSARAPDSRLTPAEPVQSEPAEPARLTPDEIEKLALSNPAVQVPPETTLPADPTATEVIGAAPTPGESAPPTQAQTPPAVSPEPKVAPDLGTGPVTDPGTGPATEVPAPGASPDAPAETPASETPADPAAAGGAPESGVPETPAPEAGTPEAATGPAGAPETPAPAAAPATDSPKVDTPNLDAPAAEAPAADAAKPPPIVVRDDGVVMVEGRYAVKGKGTDEAPYELPWELLVDIRAAYDPRAGKTTLPEWTKFFDGKVVKITGYLLLPLAGEEVDELLVMRNQWDGCCIGVPPTAYDAVEVKLSGVIRVSRFNVNYGSIVGDFKVDPYLSGKWLIGLYVMEDCLLQDAAGKNLIGT